MTAEHGVIGALVALFAVVVAIFAGALRNRGRQVQKTQIEVDRAKREVEHLKDEREIEGKTNDEVANELTDALRRSRDDGSNEGGSR